MQLSLLTGVELDERPWKVVRRVSRQVYAELRKGGAVARSTWIVITALAWFRNSRGYWPTAGELAAFMHSRERIDRPDPRLVAPRITELVRGEVVVVNGEKVRRGGGVCTYQRLRKCQLTKKSAHPVAIREAGSLERQVA